MNTTKYFRSLSCRFAGQKPLLLVGSAVLLCCTMMQSYGQGTMTFTFNGTPPGGQITGVGFIESGMTFWNPYNPADLVLTGPGISGTPQDGTGYLQVSGGAYLAFSLTSSAYFGFVSFDAAGANTSFPGASLEVLGYYAMGGMVTNYITVDSFLDRETNNLPDFETFYLSSQFQSVYRVDIFTDTAPPLAPFSLDNVVISGVPEPSTGALMLLAALCAAGYARVRRS